jgi:hypothetical protein
MLGKLRIFLIVAFLAPCSAFAETVSNEDIQSFYDMLKEMDWEHSSDSKREEIFKRVEQAVNKLGNTQENLQKNYEDLKANEQSTANKTLTALTTAATGIGGMELAMGLSQQKADKEADANMEAYMQTFRCSYGEGKQVKAGPEEIELPGGNIPELMKLRNEYVALAADLKERKTALGMKPGIESEEILDKATMGLYDDENIGITGGAYASLYRAKMLGSEEDQAKIDSERKASKNRVIGGAVAVGAGVLGGIIGNLAINKNGPKDKSKEILSEREQIASDLNDVMNQVIDECNKNISDLKNNIPSESDYIPVVTDGNPGMSYSEYVKMINDLQPISGASDIGRLKDIPACK